MLTFAYIPLNTYFKAENDWPTRNKNFPFSWGNSRYSKWLRILENPKRRKKPSEFDLDEVLQASWTFNSRFHFGLFIEMNTSDRYKLKCGNEPAKNLIWGSSAMVWAPLFFRSLNILGHRPSSLALFHKVLLFPVPVWSVLVCRAVLLVGFFGRGKEDFEDGFFVLGGGFFFFFVGFF